VKIFSVVDVPKDGLCQQQKKAKKKNQGYF
jgi:hypothetical protein